MSISYQYAISLFSLLFIISCTTPTEKLTTSVIIPKVTTASTGQNEISLSKEWVTVAPEVSDRLLETLAQQVADLDIEISKNNEGSGNLFLNLDKSLNAESYRLQVSKKQIEITGGSEAGVFYAWQSLRQLLYNHLWSGENWVSIEITDQSKYVYRGYMLDISRHFFGVETIKSVFIR